jgi:phosphate transport system protein
MAHAARSTLDRQLRELQDRLLVMGSLVQKAIDSSVRALKERDPALAEAVIRNDDEIDRHRTELEEQAVQLIATQQPMARDLRMIIAALHIATDLERMGDHAEGIAKLARSLLEEPPLKPLIDIPRMAELSIEMLHRVLRAFVERDPTAARQVWYQDDEVDALRSQVYHELLLFMLQDPRTIRRATYLIWVAHGLERIADHATNIAEQVIYLETGAAADMRRQPPSASAAAPGPA